MINKNNNLEFIDIESLSSLANVKRGTLRQWINRDKITDDYLLKVPSAGGYQYLIHPNGLPEPYRSKYYSAIKSEIINEAKTTSLWALERLDQWQRDIIDYRNYWVQRTKGLRGKHLIGFLANYPLENPDVDISKIPSNKTIYNWRKKFEANGLMGLTADYGKNEGTSLVHPDDLDLFDTFTMKQSAVVKTKAWELVRIYSIDRGNSANEADFPSLATFERAQANKHGKAFVKATRSVKNAVKHIFEPRIHRDYSSVLPGQIYVMDHRNIDVFVWNPAIKKAVRPVFTALSDYKTSGWLAWSVHFEASNVTHVQAVAADAIRKFGKPDEYYLDNGKDFRAGSFSGGRNSKNIKDTSNSMLTALGIQPIWANPYNSEAKNIEPAFKRLKERIEAFLPGYTAGLSHKRPDTTKELEKKGKESDFVSLPKFIEMLDDAIKVENYTVRKSGIIAGYSPIQVLEQREKITRISEDELAVLTMKSFNPVKVTSSSIKIDKKLYASDKKWFVLLEGTKVLPRIDPNNDSIAYIYHVDSKKLLGTIEADFYTASARPVDEPQKAQFKKVLERQKGVHKFNKKRLKVPEIDVDLFGELLKKQAEQKELEYRQTGTGGTTPIITMERTSVYGSTVKNDTNSRKEPLKLRDRYKYDDL